jgi:ATP synthase protein I
MGYRKEVFRSLSMISQIGISVMVPIFMCVFVGVMIDKYFNTSTLIVLLILGIGAGMRNAYILAKKVLDENALEKEAAEKKKREERYNAYKKEENI